MYPQYGEIWIVFDRDEVKDFDRIIISAEKHDIHVGWTNPCIEEWFFAYFGKMPVCSGSVNCCSEFEKGYQKKTNCKYSKNDKSIYEKLSSIVSICSATFA